MAVLADESERFLDAVAQADPRAQVPSCPEWTVEDLLWHLTEVHAYWAQILRSGAQTDEDAEAAEAAKPPRPDDRAALGALFRQETAALLGQLAAKRDEDPAWFWLDTAMTVGSTRRMQAHEATMHRVDAELAAGIASAPIDPHLASDGVTHGVQVMWGWWGTQPGFELRPVGGPVDLVATDLHRSWRLQPGRWVGVGRSGKVYDEPGVVLTEPTTVEAAATLSGTAEELMRWLWGRGPEPAATGASAALDAARGAADRYAVTAPAVPLPLSRALSPGRSRSPPNRRRPAAPASPGRSPCTSGRPGTCSGRARAPTPCRTVRSPVRR